MQTRRRVVQVAAAAAAAMDKGCRLLLLLHPHPPRRIKGVRVGAVVIVSRARQLVEGEGGGGASWL